MLQLVVILLVVGMVALVIEMLAPGFDGFIFGIIGICALVASAILTVIYVPFGWFFVAGGATILFLAGYFVFNYFRKRQLHGHLILNDTLAKELPQIDLTGLIGKEGVTVTMLRPYGEADFNGTRIEVTSGGPMVNKGTKVRVVETEPKRIVVNVVNGN
jgi:membrane-bound serine protease (ClpP class)